MKKGFQTGLRLSLAGGVFAMALAGAGHAETRRFSVPPGDLKTGLDAYIRQSRIQLIYRLEDVAGKSTRGVQGALTPEDALSQIISGYGFTVTRDQTGAVVVAMRSSGPEEPSAVPEVEATKEVVIVGIRRSLEQSASLKRSASANADFVTAEDVGKFPDINVAEALARLPGMAVDRSSGEGEKLSILGVDSRLNVVSLNNHPMATADYGDNATGAGRSFNYSLLAPELIGQAEIYKSYEARLDEGSVGGSVIIRTRRPLDLPKGTLSASIGYSENKRTGSGDGKGAILYSWRNDSRTFGVLASASYNNYTIGGTRISVFDYQTGCDLANLYFAPDTTHPTGYLAYGGCANGKFIDVSRLPTVSNGGPDLSPGMSLPGSINQGSFIQDRKRSTYSLALQWRPLNNLEFGFEALMIKGDYSSFSRSMQTDMGVYWNGDVRYGTLETEGNNIIGGRAVGLPVRQDLYYKRSRLTNDTYDLTAKWTPGDWVIKANIGRSRATGGVDPEYYLDFKGNVGVTWRIQDRQTYIKFDQPLDTPHLLRSNPGNTGFIAEIPFEDQIDYAGLDIKKAVAWGIFKDILFGYKTSHHTNSKTHIERQFDAGSGVYLDQFETFQTPASWAKGLGGSGDILSYRTATLNSFLTYARTNISLQTRNFSWNNFYGSEMLDAVYVQGNFEHEKWRGNAGLRYAHAQNEQTFLLEDTIGSVPFVSLPDYLGYLPDTGIAHIKTRDSQLLPAFNLVYDMRDDLLLRFNTAKVMARPSFDQMSASIKLNPQNLTATGGNPFLKPYEATNFGASVEWYFQNQSYLGVDFFYRDIGSYIVQKYSYQKFPATGVNVPNSGPVQTYLLNAPFNANDAKVKGFALNLQTNLGYGFGIVTNLTFTDYETTPYSDALNTGTYKMYMPYLSKYLFNFAPYYEHGPWQARLAYSFRTKYVTDVGVDRASTYNWTPGRNQLDFSGSYQVSDHVSLYLTASNLLDELQVPYRDIPSNPLSWTKNGKVLTFSVNYKL